MMNPINQPSTGAKPDLEMLVRRSSAAKFTAEYNCDLRRLLPWPGQVETHRPISEFGMIWVVLKPGIAVDTHAHDEEEIFVVVSGEAELTLEGAVTTLRHGDVAYIPRFARHSIRNLAASEIFAMIDVYWDNQGRPVPAQV
jgi:quercetin dioxygenase-like cupin family protein